MPRILRQANGMLEARHLSKHFSGGVVAVEDLSFRLERGQILGLLGPNGAGKTTTIQMLLGILKPSAGTVSVFGLDLATDRSAILQKVGYASAYSALPWSLTVEENLAVYAKLFGIKHSDFLYRLKKFLRFFGAEDLLGKQFHALSAGQKTRVILSKAFLNYPELVLLDEPTASLDPDVQHEVRAFVAQQRRDYGVSMLYTSHNMDEVEEVCDEVIFLDKGRLLAQASPKQLASTISQTTLELWVTAGKETFERLAAEHGLNLQWSASRVRLKLDEKLVAKFIANLSQRSIEFEHIAIERPTLEDYFLSVAKRRSA